MATKTIDTSKVIWEGWTVQNFIDELEFMIDDIMNGRSWMRPFLNKQELAAFCKSHQPYYKKPIKEVNQYFAQKYNLK
jgi:hypothetical protein